MGRTLFLGTAIGAVALGALTAGLSTYFGSLSIAVAFINGADYIVSPTKVYFHRDLAGSYESKIALVNFGPKPMRVVGYQADCSCVSVPGLPLLVESRGRQEIPVQLTVANHDVAVNVMLFVEDQSSHLNLVELNVVAR